MSGDVKHSAAKITVMVMAASVLSRCAGFVRDVILGSVLGTTYVADAYQMSVSVPTILIMEVAGAIGTTFIPVYMAVKQREGKPRSIAFTQNLFNIVLAVSAVLAVVSVLLARPILSVLAYGFNAEQMALAVSLSRIIFFSMLCLGINSVLASFLNANNRFLVTSILGAPYSVTVIVSLLLYKQLGIYGLACATLLGTLLQTLLLLVNALCAGLRFRRVFNWKDTALRELLALSVPVFIGSSMWQVNAAVDRMLASGLAEGSVSALMYANKLVIFVYSITAAAIATVIYPMMSKCAVSDDSAAMKELFIKSMNVVTLLLAPITVAACVLNQHVVRMLFERGSFNERSTALTASALFFYALGLVFMGYRIVISRMFNAFHDMKTPMINGAVALAVNIVLNLVLIRYMKHNGLALASSLSAAVATVMLLYSLRKRLTSIGGKQLLTVFAKSALAAAIMGVAVYFSHGRLLRVFTGTGFITHALIFMLLAGGGAALYVGIVMLLKVGELRMVLSQIRIPRRGRKNK